MSAVDGDIAKELWESNPQRLVTMAERIKALPHRERDERISQLEDRLLKARDALAPLSDTVFNDNGDITVSRTHAITYDQFLAAYWTVVNIDRLVSPKDKAASRPHPS